jgi:hypothetical protein
VAAFLETKLGELGTKIDGMASATNPMLQKYASQIAMLRNQPGFQDMTDEQLLPTAQLLGTKVKTPRGGVGGGKVTVNKKPEGFGVPADELAKLRESMGI